MFRASFQLIADGLQHSGEIFEHIVVPKPDDAIAVAAKFDSTDAISLRLLRMLATVDLDSQLLRRTGEVDHEPSDRMLPAEA